MASLRRRDFIRLDSEAQAGAALAPALVPRPGGETLGMRSLAAVIFLLGALPLGAQAPASEGAGAILSIPKVSGPIELDGRVQDPAWQEAARLVGVNHRPDFGAEPSERTEFLVGHDGEYLYFACRNHDSEPERIQAPSLRRNDARPVNDWCVVVLDTFHDGETSVVFGTTPAGIRTDGAVANDAETPPNWDWNTFWDAAVAHSEGGWTAELRIPFHSLGFQVEEGRVSMGVTAFRIIARRNEWVSHPAISPEWGGYALFKASQMRPVRLDGVEAQRVVHATPYLLGGSGHTHVLDDEGGAWVRSTDRVGEMGLDVQYGVGANFTVDLTLNTDFAQVEADEQQVNLDRFSLFFPEQRRFFQERASIFEFPLRDVERLFHSRRVGLTDEGEPTRIYAGARLVGRRGEWDVGLLNMQTAGSELLPSENQGVLRVRRRILNQSSYAGGILTSRIGTDGTRNVVYGADALLRLRTWDYLTLTWAQSFDTNEGGLAGTGSVGMLDRSLVRLRWERRGDTGLSYDLDLSRAGAAFEPRMGFLFRRDYSRLDGAVAHGWRPAAGSRLLHYQVGLEGSVFRRSGDGAIETAALGPAGSVELRGGRQLALSVSGRQEALEREFRLSEEAVIPAGRHRFVEAELRYTPPFSSVFRPVLRVGGGGYFDGDRLSVGFLPTWAASRHLELGGAVLVDRIRLPERDERFTARVARLRARVMFSTALSLSSFVQYNSATDQAAANLRFRYNPREGDDLYIVWNEGVNTDRHDHDPARPWSDRRTLLVKYSRTFSLGM